MKCYIVLKKCKKGKASGEDRIVNEFFKNLPENWIYYLVLSFNKILETEKIPNS